MWEKRSEHDRTAFRSRVFNLYKTWKAMANERRFLTLQTVNHLAMKRPSGD
jgi:hypothetical protein